MTATLPADVWVPVPLRARHVIAGDVIVGKDGSLWPITESRATGGTWSINVANFGLDYPDPDDVIPVLVPVIERDAVELTREQLGARLIERRMEQE